MAKTRRKSNGVMRGKFRRKIKGKGWLAHRRERSEPVPVVRAVTADGPQRELPGSESGQESSQESQDRSAAASQA